MNQQGSRRGRTYLLWQVRQRQMPSFDLMSRVFSFIYGLWQETHVTLPLMITTRSSVTLCSRSAQAGTMKKRTADNNNGTTPPPCFPDFPVPD